MEHACDELLPFQPHLAYPHCNCIPCVASQNAEPGSVLFNFSRVGKVLVEGSSEDAVFEAAMEAGAEDVAGVPAEEEGGRARTYG